MRSGFQTSLHFCCYVQEQILSYKHLDEPLDEGRFAFEETAEGSLSPSQLFSPSIVEFLTEQESVSKQFDSAMGSLLFDESTVEQLIATPISPPTASIVG